ncbi:Glycerophosphoryl diester phosphodiesterase family-domain-containing protein [Mycotypha africana]|uniref:Glycerophosphoryl diester phosphodiesterase family-domain-containing protein n=1 Tax=Mycotypha africana TaxID=64632 RepID=UPI002301574B|nr:Glycerophosphoryl diester phosphodiesterase family-domain-containing protein [Mycotypha africana]KAI8968526.1 Glycerophosphoryl diester phosphodiesterase family-domain-containing protein [Mycotypha africana]
MKFGKTLLANQIPEWSRNYIAYKSLKKDIKQASTHLPPPEEEVTGIFFKLDRELEKIDTFFAHKQALIRRRLWILQEKYENSISENDELLSALKETKNQMNKLMWFAEMNSKGFRKILKKLDKKLQLDTQNAYWETKVAVLPFAVPSQLRQELDQVQKWISELSLSVQQNSELLVSSNNSKSNLKLARYSSKNEDITKAILEDNKEELELLLKEGTRTNDTILELAVQHESTKCLSYLVKNLGLSLKNNRDINERNLLHRLCIQPPSSMAIVECLLDLEPSLPLQRDFACRRPLHYAAEANIADLIQILMRHAIKQGYYTIEEGFSVADWQDREGYTPLFFGILHGSTSAVKEMIDLGQVKDIDQAMASCAQKSSHALSDVATMPNFLNNDVVDGSSEVLPEFARTFYHPSSVAIACRLGNLDLLKLLISKGASPEIADEDGETPLLFAIRRYFKDGVKVLIQEGHVDINVSEKINGWTPLMIAAAEGFKDIVEILLKANANKGKLDNDGWTASDHAVFRGYLDIAHLLKSQNSFQNIQSKVLDSSKASSTNSSTTSTPSTANKKEAITNNSSTCSGTCSVSDEDNNSDSSRGSISPNNNSNKKKNSKSVSKASRLYGHKYLTDSCMIIITLGSNDIRNPVSQKFIDLAEKFTSEDPQRRLSLSVTATHASGECPIIDLPSDFTYQRFYPDPIVLFSPKPEEVRLRFDLIETFGPSRDTNVLARGTAILAGDFIFTKSKGYKGPVEKGSLRGAQTVPLVQAKDLDCIGTLGFEYFVITPFHNKHMRIGDRYTYYKSVDTKVIGHRGSGMNRKGSKLQVGENTVLSFITAASLGAEYVEFDVQLTKDLVPVIYHDWTVTETGYDIPLNAITSEQFLNLRRSGQIKEYHTGISGEKAIILPTTNAADDLSTILTKQLPPLPVPYLHHPQAQRVVNGNGSLTPSRTSRSHSFSAGSPRSELSTNPFELTRTSKSGKIKGNGPETIQGPFTTLAETLRSVPKPTGFNIEVKYPMIDEAEQDELTQFQELNIYVDTILDCVYNNVEEDRHVIFSSFHPEICLALNLKQPNYPVFFLTDAGTLPMADMRCNSLQGALRFARQADLLGIVAASEPILMAPHMVQVIKECGLLLFTYGVLNNEVENAVAQKYYGVDAVIVDSVLPVRKGLRGD